MVVTFHGLPLLWHGLCLGCVQAPVTQRTMCAAKISDKTLTFLLRSKLDTHHAFIGRVDVMPATSFLEPLQHCVLDDGNVVSRVVTHASDDLHVHTQQKQSDYRFFTQDSRAIGGKPWCWCH